MARTIAVWLCFMAISRPVVPFLSRRIVLHPDRNSASTTLQNKRLLAADLRVRQMALRNGRIQRDRKTNRCGITACE